MMKVTTSEPPISLPFLPHCLNLTTDVHSIFVILKHLLGKRSVSTENPSDIVIQILAFRNCNDF